MMHRFEHPWIYGHPWGYGFGWWTGMLLSALSTLFWVALLLGLAWVLLRWIIPYLMPMIAEIFGTAPAGPSALEILRQRYAAGEIDAVTFEQMRERLEASSPREILRQRYAAGEIDAVTFEQMRERLEASSPRGSHGIPPVDIGYSHETWAGYRDTFSSPVSREQRNVRMAEQERYPSETER